MATKRKKRVFTPFAIGISVLLVLYVLLLLWALGWTLMTTTKSITEYEMYGIDFNPPLDRIGNILWLHKMKPTLQNYVSAYKYFVVTVDATKPGEYDVDYNIFWQFVNSLMYSVGCAAASTGTALIMGYATARFNYRFSKFIYMFVLMTMALPIIGSLPSEIATAQALNFYDTFPGIFIMRCTFLQTYFLVFFAQFKMIPQDYTEAAKIDGANPLAIMVQIILPLAAGTTSTVFVLNFIGLWNDFQVPMIYLPSHPVAAYGMYLFQNTAIPEIAHTPTRLAGICLMAFPIIVFYAVLNKKLNVNLSIGGIKG